jgi:uncharacterized protein YcnI
VTRRLALVLAVLGALAAPSAAAAHVTVLPERPKLNAQQEFVVRVPTERDVATTKLQLLFGTDLRVAQFAPKPGWTRKVLRRANRAYGVIWSGGSIEPGEYADFRFLAAPRLAGQATFKAYQTYADGKTQQWSGPPEKPGVAERETGLDQPGPSPAVDVTATPDVPAGAAAAAAGGTSNATTKQTSSDAAIWLGVIAIVIALAAVLGVGWLWSTRPAALPPDEPGETA